MLASVLAGALLLGGPAAAQQQCIASAPQVVDDIYQQVLERSADANSAGFAHALSAGRMTVRDIVAQLAKSPEHEERFYWQPLVIAVYRQMLQRDPNEDELRDAAAALAGKQMTTTQFVAQTATRSAATEDETIRILYQRLLGREPDPDGLRAHTEALRREGVEAVARAIVVSPEYRNHARIVGLPRDDEEMFEAAVLPLYRHVLGRDPDPQGLRNLAEVAAVRGFAAVVDLMTGSREYWDSFGAWMVPGRSPSRYCGAVGTSGR